jgi:hypothetical protein
MVHLPISMLNDATPTRQNLSLRARGLIERVTS